MSVFRIGAPSLRLACFAPRAPVTAFRPALCQLRTQYQARGQHNQPQRPPRPSRAQPIQQEVQQRGKQEEEQILFTANDGQYQPEPEPVFEEFPKVKVRYLRPAIWALAVSGGIYGGLAYLEAKEELKPKKSAAWLQAPQWSTPRRSPPTPTEIATGWWDQLNPISKLSVGIIATNSAVHASSFLVPRFWDTLWHLPARNVNYTQFTSMFVHSGALHFFVNMYFLNNFMTPVGYSRLFEGSSYHTLSFFLTTGVLSGFAQHWATLIPVQKRAIPEIFIRCGGASGALFGVLGVFCMQYPTAGLGILFVPVHFDAQYVLPAIMLFDFIGMVRGYSFVNFGHAAHLSGAVIGVAYSYFDGKTNLWKPLVRYWKRQLQSKP
ncbi:Nn.00g113580.m01.CDS01 [Neocucurbitaria sp. VM-36]